MKPTHLAALSTAALLIMPGLALAQAQTETVPAASTTPAATAPAVTAPQRFADMAGSSNMFEIESSKLALETSQTQEVQEFAQQMIDDHTMAGEKMIGGGPGGWRHPARGDE